VQELGTFINGPPSAADRAMAILQLLCCLTHGVLATGLTVVFKWLLVGKNSGKRKAADNEVKGRPAARSYACSHPAPPCAAACRTAGMTQPLPRPKHHRRKLLYLLLPLLLAPAQADAIMPNTTHEMLAMLHRRRPGRHAGLRRHHHGHAAHRPPPAAPQRRRHTTDHRQRVRGRPRPHPGRAHANRAVSASAQAGTRGRQHCEPDCPGPYHIQVHSSALPCTTQPRRPQFLETTQVFTTAVSDGTTFTLRGRTLQTFLFGVMVYHPSFFFTHLYPYLCTLGIFVSSWRASVRYKTRNRRAQ
jgi:hypothetical protein